MKTFKELSCLNVNEHIEKKGNLSYLSWAWAVDQLMSHDPMATWEFKEPKMFGTTMMVYCSVTAFGKTINMHLPVMDNRNNSVSNPDSRKISDAMMRCLTKCIACFGIGLYIYAGEDLPDADIELPPAKGQRVAPDQPSAEDLAYTQPKNIMLYGKHKGKKFEDAGLSEVEGYVIWAEDRVNKSGKPMSGAERRNVDEMIAWLNEFEKFAKS